MNIKKIALILNDPSVQNSLTEEKSKKDKTTLIQNDCVYRIGNKNVTVMNNGTVVSDDFPELEKWKDIIRLSGVQHCIVGLKKDGSVNLMQAGAPKVDTSYWKTIFSEVPTWKNIKWIAVINICALVIALRSDGTVIYSGKGPDNIREVLKWKEIVQLVEGGQNAIGALRKDGVFLSIGEKYEGLNGIDQIDYVEREGLLGVHFFFKNGLSAWGPAYVSNFDGMRFDYYNEEEKIVYGNFSICVRLHKDGNISTFVFKKMKKLTAEWENLIKTVEKWKGVLDLRVFSFQEKLPPAAVALTSKGDMLIYGKIDNAAEMAGLTDVKQLYWYGTGCGALTNNGSFFGMGVLAPLNGITEIKDIQLNEYGKIHHLLLTDGTAIFLDSDGNTSTTIENLSKIIQLDSFAWVGVTLNGKFVFYSRLSLKISEEIYIDSICDSKSLKNVKWAPKDYKKKIKDILVHPKKYLAVLFEDGILRVFGEGYQKGEIVGEKVQEIELIENNLVATVVDDISNPSISDNRIENHQTAVECDFTIGEPANLAGQFDAIASVVKKWENNNEIKNKTTMNPIKKAYRSRDYLYLLHEDRTITPLNLLFNETDTEYENEVKSWKDIINIFPDTYWDLLVGLRSDGTIVTAGIKEKSSFADWQDIVSVEINKYVLAGLRKDGKVYAFSLNSSMDLSETATWENITQLSVGDNFIVGLTKTGKLLAAGNHDSDRCNVSSSKWSGVKKVICTDFGYDESATIALKSDGTIQSTAYFPGQDLESMNTWKDIKDIVLFNRVFVGLKNDGSIITAGESSNRILHFFDSWTNMAEIWTDGEYIIGKKNDKSFVHKKDSYTSIDGFDLIYEWSKVRSYYHSNDEILAVLDDETVVGEGGLFCQNINKVWEWKNISVAKTGYNHREMFIVAITKDGKLISTDEKLDWLGKYKGVKSIFYLHTHLVVYFDDSISFISFRQQYYPSESLLHNVSKVFESDDSETICVKFNNGDIQTFGSYLFDSAIDKDSKNAKYYGIYSEKVPHITAKSKERKKIQFSDYQGIVGVKRDGEAFVLSGKNEEYKKNINGKNRWYFSIEDIVRLKEIKKAVDVEPSGDILCSDGSCFSMQDNKFRWTSMRSISGGITHTIGVTPSDFLLAKGNGIYGSCKVESISDVKQALSFKNCTVVLKNNGKLSSLCNKATELSFNSFPSNKDVKAIAKTEDIFAILYNNGELWCCQTQNTESYDYILDRTKRAEQFYYFRNWGEWEKKFVDVQHIKTEGEVIRVWKKRI